jgi:hypothetical protein
MALSYNLLAFVTIGREALRPRNTRVRSFGWVGSAMVKAKVLVNRLSYNMPVLLHISFSFSGLKVVFLHPFSLRLHIQFYVSFY